MDKLLAIVGILFVCPLLFSQQFERMEFENLKYQELRTSGPDGAPPCLVVYLHSNRGGGDDNETQMTQIAVGRISDYIKSNHMPACFLVPQCPSGIEWATRGDRPGYAGKVQALILHYASRKGIDVNRIYICGASMGACGTWQLLKDNPALFASALIASGRSVTPWAKDYISLPLYITAGTEERSFMPLQWFASEINHAGGKAVFLPLPDLRHGEACEEAFSPERLKRLFSHVKGADNQTEAIDGQAANGGARASKGASYSFSLFCFPFGAAFEITFPRADGSGRPAAGAVKEQAEKQNP